MIAVIDYGVGNLFSLKSSLQAIGADAVVTRERDCILQADHVILPGVGNFGDAAHKLRAFGLEDVVRQVAESGTPFLGICVGLQLFYEGSAESPEACGLGLFEGRCRRFDEKTGFKVPQIGWNSLHLAHSGRLFEGIEDGAFVYFVHSYYVPASDEEHVKATASYSNEAVASVERGNVFACQFHPEKSGQVGLRILQNFLNLRKEA
jgi:glutamine amidotransferase